MHACVEKVLKNPEIHKKKRIYALSAIKPMEMIAATFGIALTRGAGSPFPGLTLDKAKELWTKDTENKTKGTCGNNCNGTSITFR
jgi:hypothetical protein